MSTIGSLYKYSTILDRHSADINKARVLKRFKPSLNILDRDTFVGFEVEVERIKRTSGLVELNENTFLWNNTEDNSLRNDGREFVSIPIKGEDIDFALSLLNEHFIKDKTCIGHEFTDRTSVHVHMNARNLDMEYFVNFILTYLLVEPLLYQYAGGDRAKNIFCVPVIESTLIPVVSRMTRQYELGNEKNALDEGAGGWYKYTGLNLIPLLSYGTIEFRHMSGTKDPLRLATWVNIIFAIKKYAQGVSYKELKELIYSINTTSEYMQVIYAIFGELASNFDLSNVQDNLEKTSTFIKDVFAHHKVNEKINKEISKMSVENPRENVLLSRASAFGYIKIIDVEEQIAIIEKDKALYVHAIQDRERTLDVLKKKIEDPENKDRKITLGKLQKDWVAYKKDIENLRKHVELLNSEIAKLRKPTLKDSTLAWQPFHAENPAVANEPRDIVDEDF